MKSENHELDDFFDISKISEVRFQCGALIAKSPGAKPTICGWPFETVLLEIAGNVLRLNSQDKCRNCGQWSGFQFSGNSGDTPDRLKDLCASLAVIAENQRNIRELLKNRNLKILFGVTRSA